MKPRTRPHSQSLPSLWDYYRRLRFGSGDFGPRFRLQTCDRGFDIDEVWILIKYMDGRPRAVERKLQAHRAIVAQLDFLGLFHRSGGRSFVNVEQNQAHPLFAQHLYEVDLLRCVDNQRVLAHRRTDLVQTLNVAIHGDAQLLRFVLKEFLLPTLILALHLPSISTSRSSPRCSARRPA